MPYPLTFVELFAGVGGLSLGLETAGWKCLGHAEWEAFPRRVLKHRWPEIPLWGDVSKLNGHEMVAEVGPFTMLTFGAPCQDFSVAGKREGLDGQRSVLVLDAIRIWEQSGAPLALYENVVGMLSSNKGEDFGAILSTFVGSRVAVPARGWRGGAGVACGPAGVAAWRTLDAQYFGVPQRRRRVFVLCSRDPRIDPAEVLSLAEGVSGHPAPRARSRQGAAGSAGAGARGEGRDGGLAINISDGIPRLDDVVGTLAFRAQGQQDIGNQMRAVLAFDVCVDKQSGRASNGVVSTLKTDLARDMGPVVATYEWHGQDSRVREIDVAASLNRNAEGREGHLVLHNPVTAFKVRGGVEVDSNGRAAGKGYLGSEEMALTLGTTQDQHLFDTRITPMVMSSGQANAELVQDKSPSLTTLHEAPIVFPTLDASEGRKWGSNQWVNNGKCVHMHGVPRRLTPVECERLMGWPDGWTDVADDKGRPAPDTARYKACGNGVASPVSAWIGFQLAAALTKDTL